MTFSVILQHAALGDLEDAYLWAARNAPYTAGQWLLRLRDAINGLAIDPARHPTARETRKVAIELRELLFGKRPNVFRVVFTIDNDVVRVLRIRRAQQRPLTRRQIEDAASEGLE